MLAVSASCSCSESCVIVHMRLGGGRACPVSEKVERFPPFRALCISQISVQRWCIFLQARGA